MENIPVTIGNDPGDEWVSGMWPYIPIPEPMTQDEIRDRLRGAAGDIEQAIPDAPCGEHKEGYKRVAKELRDWADEIESVQKARK